MFRIKKEQMEFFADKTKRKFVAKMAAYLRRDFAGRVTELDRPSMGGLEPWVTRVVDKAIGYDIKTEPETAQLMLLLLLLGVDADERLPWVKQVLSTRDLYAIGKVRRLVRLAREHGVPALDDVLVYPEMSDRRNELQAEA
ncbi:MAG: hypothetical protein HOW73_06005 [Polyangiaceae bacterium]|nr:hypothetical protein [Polyangiaceae bacterium]